MLYQSLLSTSLRSAACLDEVVSQGILHKPLSKGTKFTNDKWFSFHLRHTLTKDNTLNHLLAQVICPAYTK